MIRFVWIFFLWYLCCWSWIFVGIYFFGRVDSKVWGWSNGWVNGSFLVFVFNVYCWFCVKIFCLRRWDCCWCVFLVLCGMFRCCFGCFISRVFFGFFGCCLILIELWRGNWVLGWGDYWRCKGCVGVCRFDISKFLEINVIWVVCFCRVYVWVIYGIGFYCFVV